jgi:hypothetical protein
MIERIIIPIWFGTAVLIELFSSIGLRFWLRSRGVRVSPFCYGMPGCMERLYKTVVPDAWPERQGLCYFSCCGIGELRPRGHCLHTDQSWLVRRAMRIIVPIHSVQRTRASARVADFYR